MFADKLCSLSDEDLLQQYCNTRNPKAFRELYQRYKDPLFRYCAQMNLDRCASLMEDFWLALLQEPPKLHRQQLKNWLYIRVNRLLNALPEHTIAGEVGAETSLQSAFDGSDVLKAVQQLPRRQRNIFLLFNECGLSLATVADIEQISLALCRQELADGRQSITFNLHGSARKPWKSSVTIAREATEAEAAAEAQVADQPQTAKPRFPWSTGKSSGKSTSTNSATANSTVEVAQA